MFIGRSEELTIISERIKSKRFEFGIVYGRRRIGKTTLLKEVIKLHGGLYFVATEMDLSYNITQLSQTIARYFDEPVAFNDFFAAIEYVAKKAVNERLLFVIDEFTYLFAKDTGIASLFQKLIDEKLADSNIVLILSGSHVGMIEDVISYHRPLYGRTTFKINLKPFDYYDAAKFVESYSNEDKLRTYAVFGGIPYYLAKVDTSVSLKENIINLLVKSGGSLSDEVEFFLRQEMRSITYYSMILIAISAGATRLNEISTKSQVNNTGTTVKYLNVLRNLDIIEKEICFGEKDYSRKTIYKINDHLFSFFYTFIYPYKTMLTMIDPILFFDNIIANRLDEFVAFKFETACKQFLLREAFAKKQACPSEIARYWGHNHEIKQEVEIDIVRKDQQGLAVYECKWTNDIIRKCDYDNLMNKSKFLKPYAFGSFSKTGYSSDAKSYFNHTYQLDDIYDATL